MKRIPALVPVTALFALAVIACSLQADALPCVISAPVACVGEKEGEYRLAGIEFDVTNLSAKTVSAISVSCFVYPPENGSDFMKGTNRVSAVISCRIAQNEKRHLSIPLDGLIACVPAAGFLIDFLTVTRIEYADGSSIEDESLTYFTRNY